ncbi:hypothetical protein L3X38_022541 [Prunus dulcis]|uniref:Uncharacterized protein n=1 Tax=Prunus dulcis TaxID=3755 RepID=A0AAD4VY40_PRUDU|nr:hypothetical protein L3X38_022541 [Prunus dulcis]
MTRKDTIEVEDVAATHDSNVDAEVEDVAATHDNKVEADVELIESSRVVADGFQVIFSSLDICRSINPCLHAASSDIKAGHHSEQGFAFSMMSSDGRYTNLIEDGRGEISNIEGEHTGGFARSQPYVADVPCFMGSDCIKWFLEWVADVQEIFDTIVIP